MTGEHKAGPGVDAASRDDAAWFEAYPERNLRLRNRIPGEYEQFDAGMLPPPGMTARTLVIQAQPGVRVRQPVAIFSDIHNDDVTDAQLFAFFKENYPAESQALISKMRKIKLPDTKARSATASAVPRG
jgi:hypothetical protein